MFFCAKKIVYLSLYKSGERVSSAGFASLQGGEDGLCVGIQVKNIKEEYEGDYPVYLLTEKQKINMGMISINAGYGSCEKKMKIEPEQVCSVQIQIGDSRVIEGEWQHKEEEEKLQEAYAWQEEPGLKAVSIPSDKWGQLKNQYKTIHPFGDEREFISIELKDFVVLRDDYQRLVNNSFLLHGFYNYRHIILGKDYKIGTGNELCFYLGVPGVFFEREKMVAVMFGFEGFEAAGPVEIGKFGYYLKRVEI